VNKIKHEKKLMFLWVGGSQTAAAYSIVGRTKVVNARSLADWGQVPMFFLFFQVMKERAFTTFVRPTIEYAAAVWDPPTQRNINALERVQRREARFVMNNYRQTSSVTSMILKTEGVVLWCNGGVGQGPSETLQGSHAGQLLR
jgi:hypothetical protein